MYYRSGFAFSELHFMFVESKLWAALLGASCQRQDAPKSWTKIIPSPLLRYPIPSPIQSALFSIQAGIRGHQQSIDALPIRHPKGVRGHRQSIDALHIKPKGIERVSKRHPKDIQRASKRDPEG